MAWESGCVCRESRGLYAMKVCESPFVRQKGKAFWRHTTPHFMACFVGICFANREGGRLSEICSFSHAQEKDAQHHTRKRTRQQKNKLKRIRADFWEGDAAKHFSVKKGFFSEKVGGNSVNRVFGKGFYRKGNSVKRFGPFTGPPDSENWKVAVLIPFPKICS